MDGYKPKIRKKIELQAVRDHPFKTSAGTRGGGVKNWPNLPTDSTGSPIAKWIF